MDQSSYCSTTDKHDQVDWTVAKVGPEGGQSAVKKLENKTIFW